MVTFALNHVTAPGVDLPALAALAARLESDFAGSLEKSLDSESWVERVAATRAALAYGQQLGADEAALFKVFHDSSGQTWFGSHFDSIAFAREGFDPANTIGILQKDVESLLDALPEGEDTNLPQALIAALHTLKPDT